MKKLLFILCTVFVSNISIAQTQQECQTFIKFANKTEVKLEVKIYDKSPEDESAQVIKKIKITAGSEGRMAAEDQQTYYYIAEEATEGDTDFGPAKPTWKGQITAKECKTMKKTIQ